MRVGWNWKNATTAFIHDRLFSLSGKYVCSCECISKLFFDNQLPDLFSLCLLHYYIALSYGN